MAAPIGGFSFNNPFVVGSGSTYPGPPPGGYPASPTTPGPSDDFQPSAPSGGPLGGMITNFNQQAMDQTNAAYLRQMAMEQSKLGLTMGDLTRPGSLVVVDTFMSPAPFMGLGIGGPAAIPAAYPHGHLVGESAKGQGFSGNLIPSHREMGDLRPYMEIMDQLSQPQENPEKIRQLLGQQVVLQRVDLLRGCTRRMEGLQEAGLNHSAVNFSLGSEQADSVARLYTDVAKAIHTPPDLRDKQSQITLDNYARAFDLDKTKLQSSDPTISGPEKLKFQQALADHVSHSLESSQVHQAKADYDTAVKNLEQNHNSVVVSAGNAGDVADFLAEEANGARLKPPPGFYENALASAETTVVGSTQGRGADEKVAIYTSDYAAVSIYANGVAPVNTPRVSEGTSFASPKVAGVMAQLHELYPDKSSSEIESMLKHQLTHQLLSYDDKVERPVLNEDTLSGGFLSRY